MAKDKEPVDPKVAALEADPVAGLTPESIYGAAGKPAADLVVDDKPPGKPADKPPADDATPKDDKPKDDKDKLDEKTEAEKAAEAQREQWDADRQRRDQEHGNERKALEGQIALLKSQTDALQTQIAAAAKTDTDDKEVQKRAAAGERLDGLLAGLSGETDPAALAGAVRTIGGLVSQLVATPTPSSVIDASQLQGIMERLGKIEGGFNDLAAQTAAQVSETNLERVLGKFDKEYGAQHRNAAIAEAKLVFAAAGLTPEFPPTPLETELVLRNGYMKAAAGDKKAGDMPGGKPGVLPGDTGAGGSAAPVALGKSGTLQEVLADKLEKGELR